MAIKEPASSEEERKKESRRGLPYVEKDGRRRMRLSSGWSPSCSYPLWRRFGAAIANLAIAGMIVHRFLCAKVSKLFREKGDPSRVIDWAARVGGG